MGRELKRVPLDFQWPENKVWDGYLNPHYAKRHNCAACGGTGSTTARQRLGDLVSLLMLSGTDALRGACHQYLQETPLYHTQGQPAAPTWPNSPPGLPGGSHRFSGTTAVTSMSLPGRSLQPPACPKHGDVPGVQWRWRHLGGREKQAGRRRVDAHRTAGRRRLPNLGDGERRQPDLPAFATPEELARHMAGTRWGADKGTSYETWLRFINGPGWAPSMVMDASGVRTGADAAF